MTYFSIWPFFVIMALLLCILSLPYFNKLKANIAGINHVQTIDGLRGFLAYGVVFSHGQNFRMLLETGQWEVSPNPFYNVFGTVAVRLFFMVTAYLFWSKLLSSQGKMQWSVFYIKRFFRIAPVYWCACVGVFIIVMIETHWTLQVSWVTFFKQISAWLVLGVLPLPDINNRMVSFMILVGVVWTLQYEWLFYVLLPCIAWFAKSKNRSLIFIFYAIGIISISAFLIHSHPILKQIFAVLFMFLMGMLCATLQSYSIKIPLSSTVKSILVLGTLIVIFIYDFEEIYFPTILLAAVFFLIISNCSIFGLLTLPASQRMGEVSYGIYLLQGIIFYWVYSVQSIRQFVLQGSIEFWCIMTLICSLTLLLSMLVHIIVEKQGIRLGYKLSSLFNGKKL